MTAVSFKAAMIQMRSGLAPAANIDAAVRMIGEAKSAGADYVLTPEMTNIMEVKRERLFATIVEEDADTSLATLRELARKLGIYIHIGSLAIKLTQDKAANRSFLIDPKGEIAARYDKIHMFDVDLGNGESYRESNSYRPGETAVLSDLPWGRLGLTICYDLRFPALYRALAERHPESHWAQLGLVKLGLLVLYTLPEPAAPAERIAAATALLARIHEEKLQRDLHLQIAHAGTFYEQPLDTVLPHLIEVNRIGGLVGQVPEDLAIELGELSLRAGHYAQARAYFEAYLRDFTPNLRSVTVRQRLEDLAALEAKAKETRP